MRRGMAGRGGRYGTGHERGEEEKEGEGELRVSVWVGGSNDKTKCVRLLLWLIAVQPLRR